MSLWTRPRPARALALVSRAPTDQAASTLDRGSNEAIKILSSVGTGKSHKAGCPPPEALPRHLVVVGGKIRRRRHPTTTPSEPFAKPRSMIPWGARFTLPVEDDRAALAGHGLNQSGGRPPRRRDATSSTDSTASSHDGAGVEILFLTPEGSGTGLLVCGGGDIPGRMFLPPPSPRLKISPPFRQDARSNHGENPNHLSHPPSGYCQRNLAVESCKQASRRW